MRKKQKIHIHFHILGAWWMAEWRWIDEDIFFYFFSHFALDFFFSLVFTLRWIIATHSMVKCYLYLFFFQLWRPLWNSSKSHTINNQTLCWRYMYSKWKLCVALCAIQRDKYEAQMLCIMCRIRAGSIDFSIWIQWIVLLLSVFFSSFFFVRWGIHFLYAYLFCFSYNQHFSDFCE